MFGDVLDLHRKGEMPPVHHQFAALEHRRTVGIEQVAQADVVVQERQQETVEQHQLEQLVVGADFPGDCKVGFDQAAELLHAAVGEHRGELRRIELIVSVARFGAQPVRIGSDGRLEIPPASDGQLPPRKKRLHRRIGSECFQRVGEQRIQGGIEIKLFSGGRLGNGHRIKEVADGRGIHDVRNGVDLDEPRGGIRQETQCGAVQEELVDPVFQRGVSAVERGGVLSERQQRRRVLSVAPEAVK